MHLFEGIKNSFSGKSILFRFVFYVCYCILVFGLKPGP